MKDEEDFRTWDDEDLFALYHTLYQELRDSKPDDDTQELEERIDEVKNFINSIGGYWLP